MGALHMEAVHEAVEGLLGTGAGKGAGVGLGLSGDLKDHLRAWLKTDGNGAASNATASPSSSPSASGSVLERMARAAIMHALHGEGEGHGSTDDQPSASAAASSSSSASSSSTRLPFTHPSRRHYAGFCDADVTPREALAGLLHIAEETARTCVAMYDQTTTGLAPEIVTFWPWGREEEKGEGEASGEGGNADEASGGSADANTTPAPSHAPPVPTGSLPSDLASMKASMACDPPSTNPFGLGGGFAPNPDAKHSLLRPETVESLFILHRLTGKAYYREAGWRIFTALERHARVQSGGYANLHNADYPLSPEQQAGQWSPGKANQDDKMESFFTAETLKYLYLLFSDTRPAGSAPSGSSGTAADGSQTVGRVSSIRRVWPSYQPYKALLRDVIVDAGGMGEGLGVDADGEEIGGGGGDGSVTDLERWVFNTEAHPMRIPKRPLSHALR